MIGGYLRENVISRERERKNVKGKKKGEGRERGGG